jgi:hypothetical protein
MDGTVVSKRKYMVNHEITGHLPLPEEEQPQPGTRYD